MQIGSREVATADGPMGLYEARPNAGRGAVVVMQESFGVTDYIQEVTRDFAKQGFHAVAPQLYHRTGGTKIPYGPHDPIYPHCGAMYDPGTLVDIDGVFAYLNQVGWKNDEIAMVGFCMGGRVSFLAAARRRFAASVGLYGLGIVTALPLFPKNFPSLLGEIPSLQTPWLGLFGDHDLGISVADVERLQREIASAPVATQIVRYPYAAHAFHTRFRPDHYVETAARDAWERTLCWLDDLLPARPARRAG